MQKGGESTINYIKRSQNYKALVISLGNIYSEDKLMHIYLDSFQPSGKYSAQIESHQSEFRRKENLLIKNSYLYLTCKFFL